MYLENLFIKTLSLFTEEESNAKLVFLDTLWKHNNNKISVLVYRKPTETDQYLYYSSHHKTCFQEKAISSLFNRVHSIITNKDDLTQENAKIRLVLKHNMCQESIVSKIFRRITNNHSFSQSQQQAQAKDIQARRRDQKEYKFTVHSRY